MQEPKANRGLDVAGVESRKEHSEKHHILDARSEQRSWAMFGEKRETAVLLRCVACSKWIALCVDVDDMNRFVNRGILVQVAFADRTGKPYLTPAERELFLSGICGACWNLLMPSDGLAYN